LRGSLLAAAGLLSAVALGVSLMPFGTPDDADVSARDDQRPVAAPDTPHPAPTPSPSHSAAPATTRTIPVPASPKPKPTPTRKPPPPSPKPSATPTPSTPTTCQVAYRLDDEWSTGFQATLRITTDAPLTDWRLTWTFPDGQRIGQTWDATPHQDGARVTADAKDYNRSVAAHGTVAFGFVGSSQGANGTPDAFTLNGTPCANG
ncbi:cellulose-binding domain-containing protein, partial [Streptomyces seoulensis]